MPFLGEIRMFGGNFAPRSWALCQGQILAISQNQALFSILGTIYGGDGRTTFALPDLRGKGPIGAGRGPGLPDYRQGQLGGAFQMTLSQAQMPQHTHQLTGGGVSIGTTDQPGTTNEGSGSILAAGDNIYRPGSGDPEEPLGGINVTQPQLQNTGNGIPFTNMSPYLGLNYIICLSGTYPSRN